MSNKLAVLVSGSGTLCEAMIKDRLPISLVLADRKCRGIEIAKQAKIPTVVIQRRDFRQRPSLRDEKFTIAFVQCLIGYWIARFLGKPPKFQREKFTKVLAECLLEYGITHLAMAGFMTILSESIFTKYGFAGRILNSHPSLLPAFKGETAVQDALAFGVKVTGTTIHIATPKLDDGPIIAQEPVRVEEGDTVDTLWERIKVVERVLYPKAIRSLWGFQ